MYFLGALESSGEDLTYQWGLGDGSSSTNDYIEHTYNQPGNYTVSLTITASNGETDTVQETIKVLPNLDKFQTGLSSPDWLNLKDDGVLSVDLGDPVPGIEYRWDFGDGSTGNGESVSHDYGNNLGMYELKLTVVDTDLTTSGPKHTAK